MALWSLFAVALLASFPAVGASRHAGLTLWTELPNVVAQGSIEDVKCYYQRLTRTVLQGAHSLQFNKLIVRVEDPWYNDWGSEPMNGWLFNPDHLYWRDGHNPFYEMLVEVKRSLGSALDIFILPQLHQGSYFRWPVRHPSMRP